MAGEAVQDELRDYLSALDVSHPNKFGSTNRSHYFQDKADTLTLDVDSEAAILTIEHPFSQTLLGGDIHAKDKLLTIPAREESYNHSAADFTDLRFIMFQSGAKALAQKSTGLVFFWLKDVVHQDPMPDALPEISEMEDVATKALDDWWQNVVGGD